MGSRSSSTAQQSSSTYNDSRSVNDAGGGVLGNGNAQDNSQNWDASQTWTQTTTTTDSSTKNLQDSNNQTWNDNSNKSQNWTQNTVDGGAIKGMTDVALSQGALVEKLAKIAQAGADTVASSALKAQQAAIDATVRTNSDAMDLSQKSAAQAFKSSEQAIGFASDGMDTMAKLTATLMGGAQKQADNAASTAQAAYSSAASQANGNKTLTIAALAAVAVVAAAVVFRKG